MVSVTRKGPGRLVTTIVATLELLLITNGYASTPATAEGSSGSPAAQGSPASGLLLGGAMVIVFFFVFRFRRTLAVSWFRLPARLERASFFVAGVFVPVLGMVFGTIVLCISLLAFFFK